MTGQIADTFIYKGERYDIIGLVGGDLVTPEQFGMIPLGVCSACWRGFYVTYELTSRGLYLRKLSLRVENEDYKPIDGVMPVDDDWHKSYNNLRVRVAFTGKIRIAKDFIQERYVHMGFQMPTAYKTVHDVTLKDGKVLDILDRSYEVEKLREEAAAHPPIDGPRGLAAWIDKRFSLDMDLE
jgi:hypothetical protein